LLVEHREFEPAARERAVVALRKRWIPPDHWPQDVLKIQEDMRSRIWEWLLAEPHVCGELVAGNGSLPELVFRKLYSLGLSILDELH
jgi:hypothetical protein